MRCALILAAVTSMIAVGHIPAKAEELQLRAQQAAPVTRQASATDAAVANRVHNCSTTPTRPARGYPRANAARTRVSFVRTWAYLGPRAPLARSRVTIKDRSGCVLARGRTTASGTYVARIPAGTRLRLPLSVTATGGRAAAVPFGGTARARVFRVGKRAPIAQVSVASTAASRLASTQRDYLRATKRVRRSLGIGKGSLPDVLRLRNSDVGYRELVAQIRSTKGRFNGFAKRLARTAKRGGTVARLKPPTASESGAPKRRAHQSAAALATSTAPETSVCEAPLPTTGTTSDQVISDIASIGVGGLLEYAGVPTTSADGITGMLLAPIGEDPEITVLQEDVQAVMQELTCISEQINYLSAQLAELQFTVDVDTASDCAAALATGYNDYTYLVNNASQYPINAQNLSLQGYLPQWEALNTTCGATINDMLFGTPGGQGAAWQQLNENTSAGLEWYTQEQVQGLQTFLSYWGSLLYQQFILTNEVDNYSGDFEAAAASAGGTNPTGTSPVCSAGSGVETATFCVWQNSIAAAYPDDLYSDEIGIIDNGLSVNAYPGGMIAPYAIFATESQTMAPYDLGSLADSAFQSYSPTAMNPSWWWNYYLNYVSYTGENQLETTPVTFQISGGTTTCTSAIPGCVNGSITLPNWTQKAATSYNGQGLNPDGYGSAVQTFWNPQNTSRAPVAWSTISSALSEKGPGGVTAQQVFYDAINQTPSPYPSTFAAGGAWSETPSSDTAFWTNDSSSWLKMQWKYGSYGTSSNAVTTGVPLGQASSISEPIPYDLPGAPMYAFLTQRTWWPGAASATTFEPPQPPT